MGLGRLANESRAENTRTDDTRKAHTIIDERPVAQLEIVFQANN